MKQRPFRFSVQEGRVMNATDWQKTARRVEAMGYDGIYSPDHFDEQLAPISALMAAAAVTTTLRIGSLVFDNDYRHPIVLAKEAATLDVLSNGRFDFGIGAGWMLRDYEHAGIPYDSAGTRIERMEEAIQIIKKCFRGERFSFSGKHYSIKDFEATPLPVQKPHPPFLMGGGGRKMLSIAAREADQVHINFNLGQGRINRELIRTGLAEATDEKLGWLKEAAGDRLDSIELGFTVFRASVTDDRDVVAHAFAPITGLEPKDLLEIPHFLLGSVEQIIEDLQRRRERYGFSHAIVPGDAAEELAPVVERLAGK